MWISEAAAQAGVNVQTIRYYERRGLLPRSPRRSSGYREIPHDAVRLVRFIKRAQELGFSLDEIEELLRLRADSRTHRATIRGAAERKIAEIDGRIRHLRRLKSALTTLAASCRHGDTLECPIIEALER